MVVEGASCVLVVGWKSTSAELFTFVLDGPTAPIGEERRNFGASVQAVEAGLGIGLSLELNRGQIAEFLTVISFLETCSIGDKSK